MVNDSVPRFPMSQSLQKLARPLVPAPAPLQELLNSLPGLSYTTLDIESALTAVSSVAEAVNLNSHSIGFWRRDVDGILLIGPCMHQLLSMPRLPAMFEHESDRDDLLAREAVRLTGLALMAGLKELFSFFCDERPALLARLARFLSSHAAILYSRYQKLVMWTVVTACLLRGGIYDPHIQDALRSICQSASISVQDAINESKRIVWIGALMSPFEDNLISSMEEAAECKAESS